MNDARETTPSGAPFLGPVVLVFAAVDLVTPAALEATRSQELSMVLSGVIAAQFGLLAIWAVLGPQRLLVRWSSALLLATALYCVFLVGMMMAGEPERPLADLGRGILVLPLVSLAVQVPIWGLRAASGCRIVVVGEADCRPAAEARQFGLQQMLGVTAVVAASLGLARMGFPDVKDPERASDAAEISLVVLTFCLMSCVWSALVVLPCLWAGLGARNPARSAVAVGVYAVVMVSLLSAALNLAGQRPGEFSRFLEVLLWMHGGAAFTLVGTLRIARLRGYRLHRAGRLEPADQEACSGANVDTTDPGPP